MNKNHAQEVQQQTEAAKQEAAKEAHDNKKPEEKSDVMHTINPFTGNTVDITPEDLEGIEKLNEANTERD